MDVFNDGPRKFKKTTFEEQTNVLEYNLAKKDSEKHRLC